MTVWNIDADPRDADWIKVGRWDLPVDPERFLTVIGGRDRLDDFMRRPAAEAMPDRLRSALGLPVRKAYDEGEARDERGRWASSGSEATVSDAIANQRAAMARMRELEDSTPNLRDYGLDRRTEYEAAIAAHHDRWQAAQDAAGRSMQRRMSLLANKYSEDQPRVPAGSSDGGQFAGSGGGGGSDPFGGRSDLATARIPLIRNSPAVRASHDWPQTKPWQASVADIAAGKYPGLRTADLGQGTGNDVMGAVHGIDQPIVINSRMWDGLPVEDRANVLYHELGHIVTASALADDKARAAMMVGRSTFDASAWGSMAASIDPTGEELANLYGEHATAAPRMDYDLVYNEQTHGNDRIVFPEKQDAASRAIVGAESAFLGAPVGTQIVLYGPNKTDLTKVEDLTTAELLALHRALKEYNDDEARDARGRWTADGVGLGDAHGALVPGRAASWSGWSGGILPPGYLYHGTGASRLGEIAREGLVPSAYTIESGSHVEHYSGVFLSRPDNPGGAVNHAYEGALLRVPDSITVNDNIGFSDPVSEHAIPPSKIEFWGADGAWHPLAATKYSPDQARDDHGRFTADGGGELATAGDPKATGMGDPMSMPTPWDGPAAAKAYFDAAHPGMVDASLLDPAKVNWERVGPLLTAVDAAAKAFPEVAKEMHVGMKTFTKDDTEGVAPKAVLGFTVSNLDSNGAPTWGSRIMMNSTFFGAKASLGWGDSPDNHHGWFVLGTSNPQGTFWHEFGHAAQNWIIDTHTVGGRVQPDQSMLDSMAAQRALITGQMTSGTEALSGYARANGAEWFAEAFSAAYNPDSRMQASPEAALIRDLYTAQAANPGPVSHKITKFNENHDERGRFTTADGSGGATAGDVMARAVALSGGPEALDPAMNDIVAGRNPARTLYYGPMLAYGNAESVLGAVNQIARLQPQFPDVLIREVTGGSKHTTLAAWYDPGTKTITLGDTAYIRDPAAFKALLNPPGKEDWLTVPTPEGTAVHEFGHAVADLLLTRSLSHGDAAVTSFYQTIAAIPPVSGYSRSQGGSEHFAEVFSAAFTPGNEHYNEPYAVTMRDGLKSLGIWQPTTATKYSPDQPRDDHGRFADGGGGTEGVQSPSPYAAVVDQWSSEAGQATGGARSDVLRATMDLSGGEAASRRAAEDISAGRDPAQTLFYGPALSFNNPDTTLAACNTIARLNDQFPDVSVREVTADNLSRTTGAAAQYSIDHRSITLGDAAFSRDPASFTEFMAGPKPGWLVDPTPEGVATHEYGHAVQDYIGGQLRGIPLITARDPMPADGYAIRINADGSIKEAGSAIPPERAALWGYYSGFSRDVANVSGYAASKGSTENWAEVFSAAFTPGNAYYNEPYATKMRDVLSAAGIWQPTTATKYSDDEARDDHGRWTADGGAISTVYQTQHLPRQGAFATLDPTRLGNLASEYKSAVLAKVAEMFPGATPETMVANLRTVLAAGLADPAIAAGKGWYGAAHAEAERISAQTGFDVRTTTGAIAAMSPQHEWGSNVVTAAYVGQMLKDDPSLALTDSQKALVQTEMDKRGITVPPLDGTRLSTLDPMVQASVIKAMGRDVPLRYPSDVFGDKMMKATWSCGLNGIVNAIDIYNGQDPNDVLGGHKVRSFFNNILTGDQNPGGFVTIDTHAISAALGQRDAAGNLIGVASSDKNLGIMMSRPSSAEYGTKGAYPVFADAYRQVASEAGLSPEQAQAIIWLEWRQMTKSSTKIAKYSEDQPRDERGRFATSDGGGSPFPGMAAGAEHTWWGPDLKGVTRDKAEASIRGLRDGERAVLLDSQGHAIFAKGNTAAPKQAFIVGQVNFTPFEIAMMDGSTLTHNHPGGHDYPESDPRHAGSSFSPDDVVMAVNANLAEMRAVGPTATYSLRPGPGGWGASLDDVAKYVSSALADVFNGYSARVWQGGHGMQSDPGPYPNGGDPWGDSRSERAAWAEALTADQMVQRAADHFGWTYSKSGAPVDPTPAGSR